ncbi:lipopolysaccharide biosynthesis protein [Piscinibacter aquaticus]|uniref:Lipopolysaccharide biosynthesis protein n=1 Tax=Piscinibacter aquaticus TaxID=392597 RepID=A0A5C6U1I0_9BURK|nr:lipopolysaccharide biosynthesis protein [Piscinibacter aquaticus]
MGFYAATVVTEVLGVLWIGIWLFRRFEVRPALFDRRLFRGMLAFGIPMAGYELGAQVLAMGDRYVIQSLLGAQPLGVYVAAYNMCDYVRLLALSSFAAAALPTYSRIWEEQGAEATADFLRRFLHVYVAAASLVVAVTAATGGEVLAVLASAKYREGEVVVPWVIAGMSLEGAVMVCGAGLYLRKRSRLIMLLVAVAAALNIGLNLLWVPAWGITGSAAATLVSYAALLLASMLLGRGTLAVPLPWAAIAKFVPAAALGWWIASHIGFRADALTALRAVRRSCRSSCRWRWPATRCCASGCAAQHRHWLADWVAARTLKDEDHAPAARFRSDVPRHRRRWRSAGWRRSALCGQPAHLRSPPGTRPAMRAGRRQRAGAARRAAQRCRGLHVR